MAPPHKTAASPAMITALLCTVGLVSALQTTLVIPLLPDFPEILGVTDGDATWLVTISLLTGAVAMPIVSRLADMIGKRRMMALSLVMMVAGSLIAAIGGSFLTVLIGRALQGFTASLIPVAMAVLRDVLPKEKVAGAAAMISATLGIGGAMGLPAAGVLYEHLGWSSVFWVTAAAGILLLLGILVVVPASVTGTPRRFDVIGAILLSLALSALLVGISKGPAWGWSSTHTVACLAAAAVALALWVPHELRTAAPMVDLRVSAHRPVLLTNIAGFFVAFSAYANTMATTQQLQLPEITGFGFGLSAATAGLCMVPGGLAMFAFAPLSARMTNRFGGRATLTVAGLVMIGACLFRLTLDSSVTLIIVGSVLVSIGNAMAYATMPALIMSSVPITETAAANGLNSLLRAIGASSMSAVVAALLTGITAEAAGRVFPAHEAFAAMFAIATVAAMVATLAAVFLPKSTLPRTSPTTATGEISVEAITPTKI